MDQPNNPFQPPSADISPPEETFGHGTLLSKPRQVAMMRSWLWYRLSYRLLIKRPGLLMGSTFLVLLLTSLFFVLASLPFLLGWIFMAPMMVLTQHFAYRDLLTSSAVSV